MKTTLGGSKCDIRLSGAAAGGWILSSLAQKREISKPKSTIWKYLAWIAIVTILAITLVGGCGNPAWAGGITTECSYYTVASTIREGTGSGIGLMANSERLRDEGEYTCAHPTAPFGARLLITNKRNGRQIVARVSDRGPSAYLRRLGRSLDVNLSSAKALGFVKEGVTMVDVEWIGGPK